MDISAQQPLWCEKDVSIQAQVVLVRQAARDFAKRLGFDKYRQEDIALSATELAQNHVDHKTKQGLMRLFGQRTAQDESILVMSSLDYGPGMGFDYRQDAGRHEGGLGAGLGSVKRLADKFAICSGKLGSAPCPDLLLGRREFETLVAASFVRPQTRFRQFPVDFSFLIRPAGGSNHCGDGFFFVYEYPFFHMVVMDALGKGREAAEVVAAARRFLRFVPASVRPADLLLGLGRELVGTRGIMAQAARVDVDRAEILIGAAGDVCHFLFLDGREQLVSGQPGLIGPVNTKDAVRETHLSGFKEIMGIFYTDGLGKLPKLRFNQALMDIPCLVWTNYLFSLCGDEGAQVDDATLVVWKWKH